MDLLQIVPIHMGIDLGGRDISMAQELLDRSQIGPAFKKMGGEAMAKGVGRHGSVYSPSGSIFLNHVPDGGSRERLAAVVQKYPSLPFS